MPWKFRCSVSRARRFLCSREICLVKYTICTKRLASACCILKSLVLPRMTRTLFARPFRMMCMNMVPRAVLNRSQYIIWDSGLSNNNDHVLLLDLYRLGPVRHKDLDELCEPLESGQLTMLLIVPMSLCVE